MFAIHGAYYDNNFGDLLLMKIFETWLRASAPSPVVYPLVPEGEQSRFGRFFPEAQFGTQNPQQWQGLIYAGGGHFGEPNISSRKGYQGYRSWSLRFFLRHVWPAELCMRHQVPYLIAGVGVGPLSNLLVRKEVQRIFANATAVSVRDQASETFVREQLGIDTVAMVPDAALTLTREDIPEKAIASVEQRLSPYGDRPLLGIHHPRYILADTPQAEALRNSLLETLAANPQVVPVVLADDGGSKSSEPCDRLAGLIQSRTKGPCLTVPFQGTWQTVALISRLSAVMTTKLHVAIVAYAMGVYAESYAVHAKVARFYEQIERSQQCTLLENLTPELAAQKTDQAVQAACSPPDIKDEAWHNIRAQALQNRIIVTSFAQTRAQQLAVA